MNRDVSSKSEETELISKTKRNFKPKVNEEACKGCLLCVYACGKFGADIIGESEEVTSMGGVLPKVSGDCIGCRCCERFCPDFAISVEEVEAC